MSTAASVSRTSRELAELIGGRLVGAQEVTITGVASLTEATPTDASFFGNARYRDQVLPSQAAVVLVPEQFDAPVPDGRAWVVCPDPSDAFSKLIRLFAPPAVEYSPGVHASAVVDDSAEVPASVHVGPNAVIGKGVVLGERTVVGAGVVLGEFAQVGEDCVLYPNAAVRERCLLGNRVIVHACAVIGSDGFGYVQRPEGHAKLDQVGIVQIDDDVEIGALAAIDRARFGRTWVQRGTKVDNLVQIAHNVVVGENCFVIAQVGISGSTHIGHRAILAGQAGVAGHLQIGDDAVLMAKSGVSKDVPAGAVFFGSPAVERKQYARTQMAINRLGRLREAVKQLEREQAELREQIAELKNSRAAPAAGAPEESVGRTPSEP